MAPVVTGRAAAPTSFGWSPSQIDARQFNRAFPQVFPRFVQLAVWRYCSQQGFDVCNGNRLDDRHRCQNRHCRLYRFLRPNLPEIAESNQ